MNRFSSIADLAERIAPFSGAALAVAMIGLFVTTAVLILRNK